MVYDVLVLVLVPVLMIVVVVVLVLLQPVVVAPEILELLARVLGMSLRSLTTVVGDDDDDDDDDDDHGMFIC